MAVATFGAGCFWGIQDAFRQLPGVTRTTVGYAGGSVANPTYKQVCSGTTGHAEVVQLEFDPTQINYDQLLTIFWSIHDPTTMNRQGPDVGSQYRSLILYYDAEQEAIAKASLEQLQTRIRKQIVTEIKPAGPFYRAEEYHQCYLQKKQGS